MQLGVFCGLFLLRARETCFNDANGAKALLMDSRPPVLLLLLLLPPDVEPVSVKPSPPTGRKPGSAHRRAENFHAAPTRRHGAMGEHEPGGGEEDDD